jgi:hypothetical protein
MNLRFTCGMCAYISLDHAWCEADPVAIETFSDRRSCRYYRCAGCGGDDQDEEDHSMCMDGLGLILVQ